MNENSEYGNRIKKRREQLGLTTTEVAKQIGVHKSTIGRYESGFISQFGSDKIQKLAAALQTTPAYIMGWTDDNQMPTQRMYNEIDQVSAQAIGVSGEITALFNEDKRDVLDIIKLVKVTEMVVGAMGLSGECKQEIEYFLQYINAKYGGGKAE